MTIEEAINMLKLNRDANLNKPKFVKACNLAITALAENRQLKQRCMVLSGASMCAFCHMKCPDLGYDE